MELPALATGIDCGRKVSKELGSELAPSKTAVEMPGINAGEVCSEAAGDHLAGKLVGGNLPAGEDGFEAGGGKFGDAVGADVAPAGGCMDSGVRTMASMPKACRLGSCVSVGRGALSRR